MLQLRASARTRATLLGGETIVNAPGGFPAHTHNGAVSANPTAQPAQARTAPRGRGSLPAILRMRNPQGHVQPDHRFHPLVHKHREGNEDVTRERKKKPKHPKKNNPPFSRLAPFPHIASLPHAGANVSTPVTQALYRELLFKALLW